jgi:acyl-CoA synthetase (AMP-forming)/AMP-acid ligase II
LLTGGAPVGDDQLCRWRKTWPEARIEVVYGSTEAEPVAHIDADERLRRTAASPRAAGYLLGRPAECITWRVIRITKGPVQLGSDGWQPWLVEPGAPGELVVTGAHVGKNYFRNPTATAENKIVEPSGAVWHRMGDTVYADADGLLWLVGRVHSTIVRRGEFVHPQQLELAARSDDKRITHLAAVGLPDAALGESTAIVVHLPAVDAAATSADPQNTADDVLRRLHEAGHAVDRLIITRQSPPLDPRHNSKIDYPALRARLVEGKVEALLDLALPQAPRR